MLIIGERINSTRKRIGEATLKRDADFIREEARKQLDAGAQMLDVNGGIAGQEAELLSWLVRTVQEVTDVPLCLDSADPEALRQALPLCRQKPMINSITDEAERFDSLLPVVREYNTKVIALCMTASGPPCGVDDRVELAWKLVGRLTAGGIPLEDIYVDPCVFPVSSDPSYGPVVLDAVSRIAAACPGIHISCGVSNVSYGLPARKFLNEAYLLMLIGRGVDTAIIDPCSDGLIARILAAEAVSGRDEFCQNYLRAYRSGLLQ